MVGFKDLTLREGAQVPGLQISEETGKEVLERLAALEIGRVEVSFPRARPRESWFRHADNLELRTAALSRAVHGDIDAALSVSPDEIEIIMTSSNVQLEYALGKSQAEAREMLISSVERALAGDVDAGVTLMDAIRAENEFLRDTARAAVDAGAKHVTIADTTGAGTPKTTSRTVTAVAEAVGNDGEIAVHTHDDMGVATANAVAGVTAGATAVDVTVGGIGERAGNAPLEEVAVLLSERGDEPEIVFNEMVPACRYIHALLGIDIPPSKPVIGDHAFRHESGMHTAAMLREPSTYEAFNPEKYGGQRNLLFSGETGRGAVRTLLREAGVKATDETVSDCLAALKDAAAENDGPLTYEEARQVILEV